MVPHFLNIVDFAHRLVGPKPLQFISDSLMNIPGHIMPKWNPYFPRVRSCLLLYTRPVPAYHICPGEQGSHEYLRPLHLCHLLALMPAC